MTPSLRRRLSHFLFLSFIAVIPAKAAETFDARSWNAWRLEKETRARDGERSFLNLQDAVWVKPRKKVWLPAGVDPKTLRFTADLPDAAGLAVFFDGARALLSQGTTTFDLLEKKRWMVPGNLYVRAIVYQGDLRVYLHNPKADDVLAFRGFEFYRFNPKAVVAGRFEPLAQPKDHVFNTSTGRTSEAWLLGTVRFRYEGKELSLDAYSFETEVKDADYLFIPFLDQTSRSETYGAGRYLDATITDATKESAVTLDFNRAYNPLCARSKFYSCPRPSGAPLPVAIRAGEKKPSAR